MLLGVPKEIKTLEYRVGLVPASVREIISCGHQVIVETGAGVGIGLTDEHYQHVGATIVDDAKTVFGNADMIIKVKEPQPAECRMLKQGQILFTYLHLAPDLKQAELLMASGCIAIAYETVTDSYGGLPLLSPMSEVAGRMAIQAGAHCLEKNQGGRGMLLGGVPGVAAARVMVIGAGVVGTNAAYMAMGQGAHVTILDKSLTRLKALDLQFGSKLNTIYSTAEAIEENLMQADLVVGAVLLPGAAAPTLVRHEHLSMMQSGAVLIDVAIDQGGCFETSKPTTHDAPSYIIDDIVHYCVANMPGAVPRTATFALNNATLPFVLNLANKGCRQALIADQHLMQGLNVYTGHITHKAVSIALGKKYTDPQSIIN